MKKTVIILLFMLAVNLKTFSQNPLLIPILIENTSINLKLIDSSHIFFDTVETNTFGVNGSVLGPTLRFNKDDSVVINITNKIGDTTTIHWHGMHVSSKNDGGPHSLNPSRFYLVS